MRWLLITNDFPPTVGGIENYLFSLASRFGPDEVSVLTRSVEGSERFDREQPFRIHRRRGGPLLPTPDLARHAETIIRDEGVEVVHYGSPMPVPIIAPGLRRRTGVPYTVSLHGGEFVLASTIPILSAVLRRSLREASHLLCESTFVRSKADAFFGGHPPTAYLPAGVDVSRFPPPGGRMRGQTVLSVCRLVARKGPITLVRAMPQVLARHPGARLVIVGGGPDLGKLRRLSVKLGVAHAVELPGPQPWEKVPQYYSSADIFALPTRERFGGLESEGLPLVVLEAAAAGLPAVIGKAGGVTDGVQDGVTGLLVDGSDHSETAAALIELLDHPDNAARMGLKARERVESEFRWEDLVARMRRVFDEVVG